MDSTTEIFMRQKVLIENKLTDLQQAVTFLYQDYGFHQNDEFKIMEYWNRLNQAKQNLQVTFIACQNLHLKIKEAKNIIKEADNLLQILKLPESKNKSEELGENKENEEK